MLYVGTVLARRKTDARRTISVYYEWFLNYGKKILYMTADICGPERVWFEVQ